MFVVTEEMQDFINTIRDLKELLKNPKDLMEVLTIGGAFGVIYFGCIILADIVKIS